MPRYDVSSAAGLLNRPSKIMAGASEGPVPRLPPLGIRLARAHYLILMETMYFVGRGDKGEWHWSGTVSGPQNLPVTEKTFQRKNWINEEFPQDTYRVYLIIFSARAWTIGRR